MKDNRIGLISGKDFNIKRIVFLLVFPIFFLLMPTLSLAGGGDDDFEDVSISFSVPNVGATELPALIKGETLYLPIAEVFNFLKIRNTVSANQDMISGYLIQPDSSFLIDKSQNLVEFNKKRFPLGADILVQSKIGLYMRADYFGRIFGLNCDFSFRNLSVILHSQTELPVLKELRLLQMRENISKLRGERKADTVFDRIPRKKEAGAMADWSFYAVKNFGSNPDIRASLGLGGVLFGGETNLLLYYHNQEPISEKEQYYQWRYVNNENQGIKQFILGKISTPTISTIYGPIVGAQVTNTATTPRKSYDGYQYSGYTEPNWMVELYVNDQLVNYQKADPAGFYQFNVPLVYGNSVVKFKFYGPYGEERSHQLNINIPFTFLPVGELDYTATAGIVEDSMHTRFSRISGNYGLNSSTTLGAGIEYLSSTRPGAIPFANISARLRPGLLLSLDYDQGVRAKGVLSWQLPSNFILEGSYTRYSPGQTAINLNYLEDRKISISIPHSFSNFSVFTRLAVEQYILPTTQYTYGEWLVNLVGRRFSANATTYALLYAGTTPYYYSNFSLALRLPAAFTLTPSCQYEYLQKDVFSIRGDLEKRLYHNNYLSFSYERNFKTGFSNFMAGFRYQFGFGNFGTNGHRTNGINQIDQYGSGSLILEKNKPVFATNLANVAKGGMRIVTFLDLNGNGKHDPGEPKIDGLEIQMNGGKIVFDPRDTSLIVYQLEPYQTYYITLNSDKFPNIDWILNYHSMRVYIEPNQLRLIELPVSIKAEAGGRVMAWVHGVLKGQERIYVNYYNNRNQLIARTLTESDGSYTYLGLKPGRYRVSLDPDQSRRLKMASKPGYIPFIIQPKKDGVYIDSLNLILVDPPPVQPGPKKIWFKPDSSESIQKNTPSIAHKLVRKRVGYRNAGADNHLAIQMVCFGSLNHAISEQSRLSKALNKLVEVVKEGQYYKLRVLGIKDEKEVPDLRLRLDGLGYYSILIYLP